MTKALREDNKVLKPAVMALSLFFISGVAVADFATGYRTAVSLLYMVPIVFTAFFSWRVAAVIIAALSGIADTIFDYASHHAFTEINTINSATQTIFFLIFVYVLLSLKKSQARLRLLSATDPLTGLANGRYFFEIVNSEIQRSVRYKHPFTIVYLDIDNFKNINDTFGHNAGDALLREIAKKAKSTIRSTDTMARLGGDEFAILLPETGSGGFKGAVDRVQDILSQVKASNGSAVTFSIGVITNNCRPCTFDEIIMAADKLMYEAKLSGKNALKTGVFGE